MHDLSEFMDLLCGRFDNREQFEQRQAAGGTSFPFARHVNTICNQKILHRPGTHQRLPPSVLLHPGGGRDTAHLLRPAPGAGPQDLVL